MTKEYEVYKGLQKPLVFKGVKGKFIYWLAGGVLGSFILTIALNYFFGTLVAVLTFILALGTTFTTVHFKQKNGLHSKDKTKGIIYIKSVYKRSFKNSL